MQFRLATFRYQIPVFDGAPDVVTDDDRIAEIADEIADAVSEIDDPVTGPQQTTATPQVPADPEGETPEAAAETAARKGGQAR